MVDRREKWSGETMAEPLVVMLVGLKVGLKAVALAAKLVG
jgi:hypothetical protein